MIEVQLYHAWSSCLQIRFPVFISTSCKDPTRLFKRGSISILRRSSMVVPRSIPLQATGDKNPQITNLASSLESRNSKSPPDSSGVQPS